MQTLTEQIFKLDLPGNLFDSTVVINLFPHLSVGAKKLLVHRAVASGEVTRLKPGVFCLSEPYGKPLPHPFAVAGMLRFPSHISLETALSHWNMIPEAVHGISSVTQQRSRTYNTPLGVFSFQRVPADRPLAGVRSLEIMSGVWVYIAGPLRAIADLVYLRRDVTWKTDGVRFLTESMRIEEEDLEGVSFDELEEIQQCVRDRRTQRYLAGLKRELES